MKKYKTLSLLLAFCVLGCAIWYGSIAVLEKGSRPTLETIEGDVSALEGISLKGFSSDDDFAYRFFIQDGELRAKPYSTQKLKAELQQGEAEVSWNIVSEDDTVKVNGSCYFRQKTPRGQSMNAPWDKIAQFDTGLEVSQADWDKISREPTYTNPDMAQSALSYELLTQGVVQQMNDKVYTAINLPWGGANIYEVTNYSENMTWQEYTEQGEVGQVNCVLSYKGDEITLIDAMYPLGDTILVFAQTDANEPCWYRDETGRLQPLESPTESKLVVYVYDKDFVLQQTLPLLDLPKEMLSKVSVYPSGQDKVENALCFTISIADRTSASVGANWRGAVVFALDENGTVHSTEPVLYPLYEQAAVNHGMAVTSDERCQIETVQTNKEGTRMAIVRTMYPQATEYRLEVYQDGERVYWGRLHNGREDDEQIEGMEKRYLIFPASDMLCTGLMSSGVYGRN